MNTNCKVCGRPLKNPKSIEVGMGKICAGKNAISGEQKQSSEGHQYYLDDPLTEAVVLKRIDGNLYTNIRQSVRHHSPTGFECGYGGSGPADLALNILHYFIGIYNSQTETAKCWDGNVVSQKAYNLHQDFKWKFIAGLSRDEGSIQNIPVAEIEKWINEKSEPEISKFEQAIKETAEQSNSAAL